MTIHPVAASLTAAAIITVASINGGEPDTTRSASDANPSSVGSRTHASVLADARTSGEPLFDVAIRGEFDLDAEVADESRAKSKSGGKVDGAIRSSVGANANDQSADKNNAPSARNDNTSAVESPTDSSESSDRDRHHDRHDHDSIEADADVDADADLADRKHHHDDELIDVNSDAQVEVEVHDLIEVDLDAEAEAEVEGNDDADLDLGIIGLNLGG